MQDARRPATRRRQRVMAQDVASTSTTTTTSIVSMHATRGRRQWKWLGSMAICALHLGVLSPCVEATPMAITKHENGVTYCWTVGGSVYTSDLNDSTLVNEAKDSDCAVMLSLSLAKETFYVNEAIEVTWTATLRRDGSSPSSSSSSSSSGAATRFAAVDRISQQKYEVVYSRIESCALNATQCDPVTGGTEIATSVPNRPANFSSDGTASFSAERLAFATPGDVRVIAHLILPGENAEQQRFDFALYKALTILERPAMLPVGSTPSNESKSQSATSKSSQNAGLSTETIGVIFVSGMVVLVLAGLGFALLRKSRQPQLPTLAKGPDGRSRLDATSTEVDDEFAMLSQEEMLMQSQNGAARGGAGGGGGGNTFLTATVGREKSMMEESRAKAKVKNDRDGPVAFVGPHCDQRSKRHGTDVAAELASDEHIVDPSNPSSMRHNGMYMEMQPPHSAVSHKQHQSKQRIYFNDIQEHEIVDSSRPKTESSRRGLPQMPSAIDPYTDARSPSSGGDARSVADRLRGMPAKFHGQNSAVDTNWRQTTEMTFDDLRQSREVGPALTLDDLLESMHSKRSGKSKAFRAETADM